MNRKTTLLVLGVAVIIVTLAVTSVILHTIGNKNSETPIRVACVGDSLTAGTTYPVNLGKSLGPNYVVGNFGVGGATVSLNSEKPYLNEFVFPAAKDFEPNIVIIMLGTNDANRAVNESNSGFVNDYVQLVNAFQELSSKPKVWIVKPPPIFGNGTALDPQYLVQNILPNIEEVASKTGVPVIDVYTALINHGEDFPVDGIHPDDAGSQIIANVVYNAVFSTQRTTSTP